MPPPSSPSPSSLPSPTPSASFFREQPANGFQDHVARSGDPARPSLSSECAARGKAQSRDIHVPLTGPVFDGDIHIVGRSGVQGAVAVLQGPINSQRVVAGEATDFQVSNGRTHEGYWYAQAAAQVANGVETSMNFMGYHSNLTRNNQQHIYGAYLQPFEDVGSVAHHGQASDSTLPYMDNTEGKMTNGMFQTDPYDWRQNMTLGVPQAVHQTIAENNFLPMQQNIWDHDPIQKMQPQMPVNMMLLPLATPILQRINCSSCMETFTRPSDLERHIQSVHLGIKWDCFWPGCPNNRGNGYCRLEKLRAHQRQKHGGALI